MCFILKAYAASNNELFDGRGNILHLYKYLNHSLSDGYLDEDETELYLQLPNILRAHFLNEKPDDAELFNTYAEYGIIIDDALSGYDSDMLSDINYYDIPFYDPEYETATVKLAINSFHMDNPEKTYI